MTWSERILESRCCFLFDRQAAVLLAHMRTPQAGSVAAPSPQTLKGSALGIGGAGRVRLAADRLRMQATRVDAGGVAGAVGRPILAVSSQGGQRRSAAIASLS